MANYMTLSGNTGTDLVDKYSAAAAKTIPGSPDSKWTAFVAAYKIASTNYQLGKHHLELANKRKESFTAWTGKVNSDWLTAKGAYDTPNDS